MPDHSEHLRSLPDGSLTRAEVGILLDRLSTARAENERLREALRAIAITAEKVDDDPPPAVATLAIQAIARGARAALTGRSEGPDGQ